MDMYQKRVKEMKEDELITIANSNEKGDKLLAGFAWFGGAAVALGLLLFPIMGDTALLFVFSGILLVAICAPLAVYSKKLGQAAVEEVSTRGLKSKVIERQIKEAREHEEKRAERKIMLPIFAVFAIVALLIAIGLHSCGGGYTRCPKCGTLYDTGSGGANYIITHGECAKCDYSD